MASTQCPFCAPDAHRIFLDADLYWAMWDAYPVSPGHALVIPKQHFADWSAAPTYLQHELTAAISQVQAEIAKLHQPDGFNVGFNSGAAAGQTVGHLHIHVIPRYLGDMSDPRGGVRHVIPAKGNYLVEEAAAEYMGMPAEPLLTTGVETPLLPQIKADIDKAVRVDIGVAFTTVRGLLLLQDHLEDLLASRQGQLRFLTGDYLDFTDPVALRALLDLEGNVTARVFETSFGTGFHPKTYICHFPDSSGVAYVGSSNITQAALQGSVEWNYRVIRSRDEAGFAAAVSAFERLFAAPQVVNVNPEWISQYEKRRPDIQPAVPADIPRDAAPEVFTPHEVQQQALEALQVTREAGNTAGLVVLATGLGKTWLSAFDSYLSGDFKKVLFVAHRDEILTQALNTFRKIRPKAVLGRYTGTQKNPDADVLFASIQTLGRSKHLRNFRPDEFDYIVVDEFHHAAAATYRKLIDYFEPKFLLGLTATPERTDGGDLLGLCQENLVFRYDLHEGINSELLSPFKYFGVPDEVDYQNIPWRSRSFDPAALETALATQARAQNALEQYKEKAGGRTFVFCCSQRHAEFMSGYFNKNGLRSVAVYAGPGSAPRADALEKLTNGELDIVCSVDMFNEGVDVPSIDTVMLLRPTESSILWLQQIGRGLRKADGKGHLTIIDYIGNHRSFLNKPKTLLQLGAAPNELRIAIKQLREQDVELPLGCEVTYDLEALDILESLLPRAERGTAADVIKLYYESFFDRTGYRPTALEAFHDGYDPKTTASKSWLAFVLEMGGLADSEKRLVRQHAAFFASLDKTRMVKSYKMVLLQAMLSADALPGGMAIEKLVTGVRRLVNRSARLQADFANHWGSDIKLRKLLEENPIAAWVGARSTAEQFFRYQDDVFSTSFDVAADDREAFAELVREVVDWRLAEYLYRADRASGEAIVCRVIQSNGKPFIKLPDGDARKPLPHGKEVVSIDGTAHMATFAKIAVNVVERMDDPQNILPEILQGWFGPDAGQPGTRFDVGMRDTEHGWAIEPLGLDPARQKAVLWERYTRKQIPGQFDLEYSQGLWGMAGFIIQDNHMFLLVNRDKAKSEDAHKYKDYFIDRSTFHWQSQNRTTPSSAAGQKIKNHADQGIAVHLFVRERAKERNKTLPFYYCGDLEFMSWEGGEANDEPISVTWKLKDKLSERLFELFEQPG